jgi:hypothetical protein
MRYDAHFDDLHSFRLKIKIEAQTFGLLSSTKNKNFEFILSKTGLGYSLGYFFTNISGHPVCYGGMGNRVFAFISSLANRDAL